MDDRVRTGLFVDDIKELDREGKEKITKESKKISSKIEKSSSFQKFVAILRFIWKLLLKIPFFETFYILVRMMLVIVFKYYAILFITFAFTFPTLVLLMNFFDSNVVYFFIGLLPIVLWNIYCLSALYICIQKREKGERIQLWPCYGVALKQLGSVTFISLAQLAVFIEVMVLYSIVLLFFSYFFDAMGLPWGDSFIYWFVTIFFGLLLLIGLFIFTIILHQAYFSSLFEAKKTNEAFHAGLYTVKTYASPIIVFYLLVYILACAIIYWASLYYLYIGFALSIYLLLHMSIFLGFLLRKHFFNTIPIPSNKVSSKPQLTFSILILFGFINYILSAFVITSQFQYITSSIEKYRDNYFLTRELVTYTNDIYRFMIQYPQNWADYKWRGSSVTFYNNYTGTETGGIWLNISVTSYSDKEFLKLYEARPGIVSVDETTQDVTTKVSNISVQGYPGVNYTFYHPQTPYPQYQTHYIIHKDQYIYKITFTTLDKDVEGNNTDLFERIVGSFRFIE